MCDESQILNNTINSLKETLNKASSRHLIDKLIEAEFELAKGNVSFQKRHELLTTLYSLVILNEKNLLCFNTDTIKQISKYNDSFNLIIEERNI